MVGNRTHDEERTDSMRLKYQLALGLVSLWSFVGAGSVAGTSGGLVECRGPKGDYIRQGCKAGEVQLSLGGGTEGLTRPVATPLPIGRLDNASQLDRTGS